MISDIALHEAAHCVAALRHGIGVHSVCIDRGEVVIEPCGSYLEQGQHHGAVAAGYAIIALAGQAAAPKTGMSKSDQILLQNAFFLASWADSQNEMRLAFSALAEDFVLDHREQIENLAGELDRRRRVTGAELAELFQECGGHD